MDTILVVDDERLFLTLVRDELVKAGYSVLTAENAQEALEALAKQPVQAVIMDVVMPGADGMELLPRVRKDYPQVPVVVVSGRASFLTGVHAMRLGAVDFLRKPLNFEELGRTVQTAIAQRRTAGGPTARLASLERLQQAAVALSEMIQWDTLGSFLKDNNAFFQRVIELLAEVVGVEIVSIMLVHEPDGTLRIAQARGLEAGVQRQAACRVGEGISGAVAKSGQPLLIRDLAQDARFAGRPRHPRYRTDSLMCVPLKVNGKTVGVLNANNKVTGEPFDELDLAVFTTFACLVSLGLATAQLFEQLTASVDELATTNARLARANGELEARLKELQVLRGKSR
ncbi:MAG: response regulator [Candidatus Methylomirabilales bacterium]